jgi:SAM-dependent methyltransferase
MQNFDTFEGLLELMQGERALFRYSLRDLAERYGEEYKKNALFLVARLAEFAAANGETLADALDFYQSYIVQVAEERRCYQEGARREVTVPKDLRFKLHYLYALTLSTAFNRSRYELFLDYRRALGEHVQPGISILEVGVGNCLDAGFASSYGTVRAYEKNELSEVWHSILGLEKKVDLRIEEYCFDEPRSYDLVTLIEILEHLSDPGACLESAHRVLKDDGLAYLTFALRMPQIDHLHDFSSLAECRNLLQETGFTVLREQSLIDTYRPFEESERWQLADDSRQSVLYCCMVRKVSREACAFFGGFNEDLD